MKLKKGFIQVYTGDGKGKTTASVGLAARSLGAGLKVCFIQFFKQKERSSEFNTLKLFPEFTYFNFCPQYPYWLRCKSSGTPAIKAIKKECCLALEFIKETISSGKYDVVIVDELDIALKDGHIDAKALVKTLERKNKRVEVVITGSGAARQLISCADLVTEMKAVKHYFKKGVRARKGIEY